MVNFKLNGGDVRAKSEAGTPLLWVLRDEFKLIGTKFGCGAGLCGACTVHINGVATRSCVTQIETVQGKRVTTIEGLSAKGMHPVQKVWLERQVAQCGYCQTGQIMTAAALVSRHPKPNDAQIEEAMNGNICRCGTYPRIKAAIKQLTEA
jgi:isoquinoline 1-oxidoreductase subunit alpha